MDQSQLKGIKADQSGDQGTSKGIKANQRVSRQIKVGIKADQRGSRWIKEGQGRSPTYSPTPLHPQFSNLP